jgi:hypothetical protein
MSMSPCPFFHVHVNVSMSMSPCLHVPMSSMSSCFHVSMCPCVHVSICPYAHMPMSPCFHVSDVSVPMPLCLNVSMSMSPSFHVSVSSSMFSCPRPCFYFLVRVAEPEPDRTVFIWGLRQRNRIRNTVPVPSTRKLSKKLKKIY